MERKNDAFRIEAAGSLTPALEGAPRSGAHPRRTEEKGRSHHEAGQAKEDTILDHRKKGG